MSPKKPNRGSPAISPAMFDDTQPMMSQYVISRYIMLYTMISNIPSIVSHSISHYLYQCIIVYTHIYIHHIKPHVTKGYIIPMISTWHYHVFFPRRVRSPCWPGPKELYELKELIGRGSSGRVFRAVRKEDKLQVGHRGPWWVVGHGLRL